MSMTATRSHPVWLRTIQEAVFGPIPGSSCSQARKVILFEQPSRLWSGDTYRRWLYTAVTRAREELLIIG